MFKIERAPPDLSPGYFPPSEPAVRTGTKENIARVILAFTVAANPDRPGELYSIRQAGPETLVIVQPDFLKKHLSNTDSYRMRTIISQPGFLSERSRVFDRSVLETESQEKLSKGGYLIEINNPNHFGVVTECLSLMLSNLGKASESVVVRLCSRNGEKVYYETNITVTPGEDIYDVSLLARGFIGFVFNDGQPLLLSVRKTNKKAEVAICGKKTQEGLEPNVFVFGQRPNIIILGDSNGAAAGNPNNDQLPRGSFSDTQCAYPFQVTYDTSKPGLVGIISLGGGTVKTAVDEGWLQIAQNCNASKVVIQLGNNEGKRISQGISVSEFEEMLRQMIHSLRGADIILISPFYAPQDPTDLDKYDPERSRPYFEAMKRMAKEYGIKVVDVYKPETQKTWFQPGSEYLHLNEFGHQQLALAINEVAGSL